MRAFHTAQVQLRDAEVSRLQAELKLTETARADVATSLQAAQREISVLAAETAADSSRLKSELRAQQDLTMGHRLVFVACDSVVYCSSLHCSLATTYR